MTMKKPAPWIRKRVWKQISYSLAWHLARACYHVERPIVTFPISSTLPPSDAIGEARTRYMEYRSDVVQMCREETP